MNASVQNQCVCCGDLFTGAEVSNVCPACIKATGGDVDAKRASTSMQEVEAIQAMLNAAEAHGLTAEAVWSFGNSRANGSEVADAASYALTEWDL